MSENDPGEYLVVRLDEANELGAAWPGARRPMTFVHPSGQIGQRLAATESTTCEELVGSHQPHTRKRREAPMGQLIVPTQMTMNGVMDQMTL